MVMAGRLADTASMTYARSQIAPLGEYGCFHVVTRCVRRAFLCARISSVARISIISASIGNEADAVSAGRGRSECVMPKCVDRGPNPFSR